MTISRTGNAETYMIAPEYQRELYKDVRGARYNGYEISVTSIGAAFATSGSRCQ